MTKGHGHNDGHDLSEAPPSLHSQDWNAKRNSVVIVPTDRIQIYLGDLAPCRSRQDLAIWTCVRLNNPRLKINYIDIVEEKHWERHNNNNDNRTLNGLGDNTDSESIEGDQIHSEASEERPGISFEDS